VALWNGAAQAVYTKFPFNNPAAGPNYAFHFHKQSQCAVNIGYLVQGHLLPGAGGTGPWTNYLIAGLDEINAPFDFHPLVWEALWRYIKAEHGLSGESLHRRQ